MNKKILSIISTLSLAVSTSLSALAVPSAVQVSDSAFTLPEENLSDSFQISGEDIYTSKGPSAIFVSESTKELDRAFLTSPILASYLNGDGTAQSPYIISSKEDLLLMAQSINTGNYCDSHYKLTCDIDMNGAEWTPIGDLTSKNSYNAVFSGVFDGDGHTVSNFVITSSSTQYVGFFGYCLNAKIENLNIDSVTIDISLPDSTDRAYAGVVSGRMVAMYNDSTASFSHCNVSNSSVTVSSGGIIYAGGLTGSFYSEKNYSGIEALVSFCNVDCDVSATNTYTTSRANTVNVGAFIGFLGSEGGTSFRILNSSAKGSVLGNALKNANTYALVGGFIGNIQSYNVTNRTFGTVDISSCYSSASVTANSQNLYNAGGFAGQILNGKTFYISDSYASGNVSAQCTLNETYPSIDPAAGGFAGVITFPTFSSSLPKTIVNCYANGNVVDLRHSENSSPETSYVGAFVGYTTAGMFENCYKYDFQTVTGSDVFTLDTVNVLSFGKAYEKESYVGFDFKNTWKIDADGEYKYPTLQKKSGLVVFLSDGKYFAHGVFGDNGKVKVPKDLPTKQATVEKQYKFSHWSFTENGTSADLDNLVFEKDSVLYSVFSESSREYKVNFVSEGNNFVPEQVLVYGSSVALPASTPKKSDDEKYYYEFSHWSQIAGGEAFDFSSYKLSSDITFYAVFNQIDKSAWTGGVADKFESGYGTKALPYVITTADQFALFGKVIAEENEKYEGAYFKLGADINLGGRYWKPVGTRNEPFCGHFDGGGYTVGNYKVSATKYAGLFGYAVNATIENVYLSNFEINISSKEENALFVGGVVGYFVSSGENSTAKISCVRVSSSKFNVTSTAKYSYIGNIVGTGDSKVGGTTLICDSFATSDVSFTTDSGYGYVGGIAGLLKTGSGAKTLINHCYNIGAVSSTSYHSSNAGGLVGHIFSYGSSYAPSPGETEKEGLGDDPELSDSLAASDADIMISDSFAISNVTANSTHYSSNAGQLVGSYNVFATVSNIFYPRNAGITVSPEPTSTLGSSTSLSNLKSEKYLSENREFDFDNTWVFISGYEYPVLKCMVSDKPELRLVGATLDGDVLSASVLVSSAAENYTVIVGVYDERNRLISVKRLNFKGSALATEFEVEFSNVQSAKTISVSAYNNQTLSPLFDGISKKI